MLSPEELAQFKQKYSGSSGASGVATRAPVDHASRMERLKKATQSPVGGFFSDLKENVTETAKDVGKSLEVGNVYKPGEKDPGTLAAAKGAVEGGLQATGALGRGLARFGSSVMDRTGASEKIAEKAAPVIDAIPDGIKEGASKAFTFAGDQYKQWAEKHPEAARNLENIKDTASGAATIEGAASLPGLVKGGVKLAEDVAKNTVNVAKGMGDDVVKTAAKVTDKVADTVGNPTELFSGPKDLDKSIEVGLSKGIRPSVSGKSTFAQNDAYMSKGKDAVKTIVERKGGLKLVDDAGETVELPQNLKQFSEAIEQTKSGIFKEYDDLAKQAGQAGAKVELAPIADELEKTAKDSVLKTHAPGAAGYAEERAAALRAAGSHTTEDAQRAIQLYNKSLEAFYRNPTYDTASRAAIDAMIANKMRISLDDVVEQFTDIPGYQALKNKYGALKTIEADVTKRALVDARKNMKGLLDFTDIASGGELVSSLLTMNPASFAKAATMKGLAQYFKYLNDPNTAIKNMFKNVDKAIHGVTPK